MSKIVNNVFWKMTENVSYFALSFLLSIFLARILMPEDYGLVAISSAIVGIASTTVKSGIPLWIIQKKQITNSEYSSALFTNGLISIIIYVLILVCSYLLVPIYGEVIVKIINISSVSIFFVGIYSVQNALLTKNFEFKKIFFIRVISTLISSLFALYFALNGLGVWSLVLNQLLSELLVLVLSTIFTFKYISLVRSIENLKDMMIFGIRTSMVSLIDFSFSSIQTLLIGGKFGSLTLGFYSKAQTTTYMVTDSLNNTVSSVTYPTIAIVKDDLAAMKKSSKIGMICSSIVIFPLVFGFASISQQLVQLLLTDKWSACAPMITLIAIGMSFFPFQTINMHITNTLCKTDITLKLEIFKKVMLIFFWLIFLKLGVLVFLKSYIVYSIFCMIIQMFPNYKLINYGIKEQFMDILPSIIFSVIMVFVLECIGLSDTSFFSIILKILIGGIIYISFQFILNRRQVNLVVNSVKLK